MVTTHDSLWSSVCSYLCRPDVLFVVFTTQSPRGCSTSPSLDRRAVQFAVLSQSRSPVSVPQYRGGQNRVYSCCTGYYYYNSCISSRRTHSMFCILTTVNLLLPIPCIQSRAPLIISSFPRFYAEQLNWWHSPRRIWWSENSRDIR